jgi:hypothetical protein
VRYTREYILLRVLLRAVSVFVLYLHTTRTFESHVVVEGGVDDSGGGFACLPESVPTGGSRRARDSEGLSRGRGSIIAAVDVATTTTHSSTVFVGMNPFSTK